MKFLDKLSLTMRFGVVASALILITAFSTQRFFAHQERIDLEMRLKEKSIFINAFYSFLIADALTRKDDVTLQQVMNRLEEDQEITSVIVVDQTGEVRYHADAQKMGTIYNDPAIKNVLMSGQAVVASFDNAGGRALALVCPLKVQGSAQPIGAVRIDFTYRRIENQLTAPLQRYWFVILGSMITCLGFMSLCVRRWVTGPLEWLRMSLRSVNPAAPEPNLRETSDDFGQVNTAINDLLVRFKSEWQQQWSQQQSRGEQEKAWIHQLARSFMPDARLLIVDKDNRVLSDTGNGVPPQTVRHHLMDLIKDANFATLLTDAFQKEGEVVRGTVSFEDKNYLASVISVPVQQAVTVKTLIALQPY